MVQPTRSLLTLALCSVLSVLGGVLPLPALCGPAWGQEQQSVAVLDVTGAPRVHAVAVAALRQKYAIVPAPRWAAAAKRLNATGHAADEIALVAGEVKAAAVVTGTVKKDKDTGDWVLTVSARNGTSGKAVEKLKYPLRGKAVDKMVLAKLAEEIGPAVEKAITGAQESAPAPEPVAQAPEPASAEPPGKDDDPFEKLRQAEEAEKRRKESIRPKWYPYVDAGVGFVLGGRRFSFDEEIGTSLVKCYDYTGSTLSGSQTLYQYTNALKKCPGFAASVAPGLRIDATVYPLAWLRINPLRGLGIGGMVDLMFWPSSKVCNKNPDGTCVDQGTDLGTAEYRAEIGLRWHWNILNRRSRPSLRLGFNYGFHSFSIQKQQKTYTVLDPVTGTTKMVMGVDDHGLPDIAYQYLDLAIGGRVPYYANDRMYAGLMFDFHYHIMLDYGDIETRFIDPNTFDGGYGPVSGGYGLRVEVTPLEYVWKGLTARVQGYYEVFSMSFALANPDLGNQLPPANRTADTASRHIAQGATDNYFGGVLQIGYQY